MGAMAMASFKLPMLVTGTAAIGGYLAYRMSFTVVPAAEAGLNTRRANAAQDGLSSVDLRQPNKYGEVNHHFWQRDATRANWQMKADQKSPPSSAEIKDLLRKDFNRLDTKKTGVIDFAEATAAGMSQETFQSLDTNHDGVISWEEYLAGAGV